MDIKNRSWYKFSVVIVVVIALAFAAAAIVRSPGSRTKPTAITHVSLIASTNASSSTRVPVVGVLPSGFGWALTTAGLELTADGGSSFSVVQSSIPVSNIGDVAVNDTDVMVAGVRNFSPVIESSSDSGATWKSVALPVGSGNVGGVQLVTQSGTIIGMMATEVTSSNFSAGQWYSTSDRGLTWTRHLTPSGGVVKAVGGNLWLAGGPQFASLYQSSDHGLTWSKVPIPTAAVTNGAALSVPGELSNGNVVLVATTPNADAGSTFEVTVYVSSDLGARWSVLAKTSFAGQISPGIAIATSAAANTIWLGAPTDPNAVVVSSNGTLTTTSSINGVFPGGSINSINATRSFSAWVTTVKSECPSGKASCTDVGALIGTVDGGSTWSLVNLVPAAAS